MLLNVASVAAGGTAGQRPTAPDVWRLHSHYLLIASQTSELDLFMIWCQISGLDLTCSSPEAVKDVLFCSSPISPLCVL